MDLFFFFIFIFILFLFPFFVTVNIALNGRMEHGAENFNVSYLSAASSEEDIAIRQYLTAGIFVYMLYSIAASCA